MQVHERSQVTPVLAPAEDLMSYAKPCTSCMNDFLRENGGIFERTTARQAQGAGGCNSGSVRV